MLMVGIINKKYGEQQVFSKKKNFNVVSRFRFRTVGVIVHRIIQTLNTHIKLLIWTNK